MTNGKKIYAFCGGDIKDFVIFAKYYSSEFADLEFNNSYGTVFIETDSEVFIFGKLIGDLTGVPVTQAVHGGKLDPYFKSFCVLVKGLVLAERGTHWLPCSKRLADQYIYTVKQLPSLTEFQKSLIASLRGRRGILHISAPV